MAERLTRARAQVGVSPTTVVDPTVELLKLFSEARQDAIGALQGVADGRRKLSEACAKVRQASAQLLEMVRDDLEYQEDPMGEGGGLAKPTTARLPQAQAGRVVAFLVDACHLTMRAVLQQCDQDHPPGAPASLQPPGKDAAIALADGGSADGGRQPGGAAAAAAQLWRAASAVSVALQDASRLLGVPRFYSAFTIADPSCDSLLSVGELAAAVMRRASAASTAATAAAREALRQRRLGQQQQGQQHGAIVNERLRGEVEALVPPDASCLLAAHGSSLLLVACEQQPESLLDAMLRQPGGSERLHLIASATLELAAARITETAFCGGTAAPLPPQPPASASEQAAAWDPSSSCASSFSFPFRQLQLLSLRFSELLADDGSYKAMSKRALLPALAEALLAEPNRFVSWWGCGRDALHSGLSARDLLTAPQLKDRATPATTTTTPAAAAASSLSPPPPPLLPPPPPPPPDCASSHDDKLQTAAVGLLLKSPAARNLIMPLLLACVRLPGGGAGLAAFGEGFAEERFICGGEGAEREELYVGGRGRGYKRRKILNPDVHGVNSEQVAVVLTAMASALECAVLMCKLLSNASVDPPEPEPQQADPQPQPDAAPLALPPAGQRPLARSSADADDAEDPIIGPPGGGGGGGGARGGGAAMDVDVVPGPAGGGVGVGGGVAKSEAAEGQQGSQSPPLATAFLQLLEQRYGVRGGGGGGAVKVEGGSGGGGSGGVVVDGGADAVAAAAAAVVVSSQMAVMGRNLATLLSLLLPVCPGGGEEVRDSIRQLGYPSLRWPRMNVRLPILVVEQDCELLVGLLEDVTAAASEAAQARRREEEEQRRQRDADAEAAKRDEKRRKRHEQEQKEAERRQRDKERRQRDRDRLKAMKAGELAAGGGGGGGEYDGGGGGGAGEEFYGLEGGDGGAAAGGHQPKVRLVLRRGDDGAATTDYDAAAAARQLKRARPGGGGDDRYDEDYGPAREEAAAYNRAEDPVFAARLGSARGAGGGGLGNGMPPDGVHANMQMQMPGAEGGSEDAAALRGLQMQMQMQVPRQRRSDRPTAPTPQQQQQQEEAQQRFAAAAQAGGREGASGGGGGYSLHPHSHSHSFPPHTHAQQQQQYLEGAGYGDAPSPLKRASLGAGGGGGGVCDAMAQQYQQAHHRQPGQGHGPMGHLGARPPEQLPPYSQEQQRQSLHHMPRQPPPSYTATGQPPQSRSHAPPHYPPQQQQYSPQQHYSQQQQQPPRAQQQYGLSPQLGAHRAGALGGVGAQTSPRGPGGSHDGGGGAEGWDGLGQGLGWRRLSGGEGGSGADGGGPGYPPQHHHHQQQQQQQQYPYRQSPHARAHIQGGGGGGGGYATTDASQGLRQHAADPYGLVQQQQQQYQQQYGQRYEQEFH
ncbi:hypothetical protein PLESTM_001485800 [Pleodorina starrii]|nr:hypothetical protein PLESTM_001485800 [Pleodorina starrii]